MSTRIARTTFMPWREIEMSEGEYQDLLRQGLIWTEPEPEPVVEAEPADEPKPEAKPDPAPRRK